MRKVLFILSLLLVPVLSAFSQDPKLDKLEMFYDQGHYGKVYRKSKRLLKDTAYSSHALPYLWKALSEVGKDIKNGKNPEKALTESASSFQKFKGKENADYYLETYRNEILDYQDLFLNRIAELKFKKEKKAEKLYNVYVGLFSSEITYQEIEKKDEAEVVPKEANIEDDDVRTKVISEARQHIGTPYKWGGTSADGFDCSGYTSYVMAQNGIEIARMAQDQGKSVNKISPKKAQPGDLVFFGKGTTVTHVGIVVSNPGEELKMIHASSSKGIMISNIETSSYWKPRLLYTGTVIN